MATDFPITEKKEQKGIRSRDWQLALIIVGVVVLFFVLLVPLGQTLKYMLDYHGFINDVSASTRNGRDRGSITATYEGETYSIDANRVGQIISILTDAGAGRVNTNEPEDGFLIDFGDGSSLSISPVAITTTARLQDTGALIRYTRSDGTVFAYDSDKLGFDALLEQLHLPS